jgi:hypothetical protein
MSAYVGLDEARIDRKALTTDEAGSDTRAGEVPELLRKL